MERWRAGDVKALDCLLARHLSWIKARVRERLGRDLHQKAETGDIVQDAMVRFLHDGPKLRIDREEHFRNLMVRIVENVIRDQNDWFSARRRDFAREDTLSSESELLIRDGGIVTVGPSGEAVQAESRSLVRLAIELLDPIDRQVVVMRRWDGRSHAEIGAELGMSEAASSMRYTRAVVRLTTLVAKLRTGGLDGIAELGDVGPGGAPDGRG